MRIRRYDGRPLVQSGSQRPQIFLTICLMTPSWDLVSGRTVSAPEPAEFGHFEKKLAEGMLDTFTPTQESV